MYALLVTTGKTTFFVANQANFEDMPADKLKALEDEHKAIEEANRALLIEVKAANAGREIRRDSGVISVIYYY